MDPNVHGGKSGLSLKRVFILVAAATSTPALAQYPPPDSVAPPGSIIVSRDVPQRPAFAPGQPGTVHAVETAPVALIFGATNQVTRLSDDQSASVSAGIQSQNSMIGPVFGGGDGTGSEQLSNTTGQATVGSFGSNLGSTISNTIGVATGAIGRALSPLSGGKGD